MAKLSIAAGATSQTVNVFIQNSSSTTGAGLTGLVYNSTGLTAYYVFPRAASAAITLVTLASATAAWSSGGFKEIDSTNCPGLYRFDIPNAVLASGNGRFVTIYLQGATNMAPCVLEIELTGVDNQDATAFGLSRLDAAISSRMATFALPANFASLAITAGGAVTAGTVSDKTGYSLAALDAAALESGTAQAGATGSITLRSGASATDHIYRGQIIEIYGGTGAGQARVITGYAGSTKVATVDENWITNPDNTSLYRIRMRLPHVASDGTVIASAVQNGVAVTANADKTGYGLSAAAIQAIWDALTSNLTTTGSIGKRLADNVDATISSRNATTPPTAAQISTQVWSEALPGSYGSGTAGAKLNAAGSAGDPWSTVLPGSYPSGTAGNIVGNRLDAAVSSRLSSSALTITSGKVDVNDKTGFSLSSSGIQAIWDALTSALTTVGSIGKLLVTNIDAAISSRSTYAGGDTAGTTTLLSRIPGTVQPQSGDAYARLGAPSGASVSADIAAIPTANANADALLDRADAIETGWTPRGALRVILAALAGKVSGAATTTVSIRNVTDTKNRITATVDSNGNRTAVTTDNT